MRVECFKLVTGEDVLAEVKMENEFRFVLVNPVGIAVVRGKDGNPNVGLAPFPMYSQQGIKGATIDIPRSSVVYHYVPTQDFLDNYDQIFGAGLVLPKPKQLITE